MVLGSVIRYVFLLEGTRLLSVDFRKFYRKKFHDVRVNPTVCIERSGTVAFHIVDFVISYGSLSEQDVLRRVKFPVYHDETERVRVYFLIVTVPIFERYVAAESGLNQRCARNWGNVLRVRIDTSGIQPDF